MKVKDLERTANVAWSPESHHPIYLAAGTAAQQLDASFNTNAALELYSLNLSEPGPDLQLKSSIPSEHRFHKIIWGDKGDGTVIGGCDGGLIQIYNANKLINSADDSLVDKQEKHTGPVHALDLNPFQQNLFASGAGDSEIFIWDLNHTSTPMSPGAKSQPSEDVLSVAWNRQVQHILASTFSSKCVIWDLRKNEPIIKLTDTVSRIRWKNVAWHPEVATQLCLASEEDHSPIIQLWDLRFATSPLKTLENHQRGVLSLAWCSKDADLLVSCGKDNRILCWNPNSNQQNGEVLSELAKTNQWTFDIAWCPKNPALIACPNFDGHVSIYSLMGGKTQQVQTTNKIADSFPGMDGYVQAPVPQGTQAPSSVDLTKPPKWLKKPVGAKFGFGGKLVTFENDKEALIHAQQLAQTGQVAPQIHRTVQISQVITEPDLVKKSMELEQALEYGNFTEYCVNKADLTNDQHKKYIWHFLKANFDPNPRSELLNLLGYRIEEINEKLSEKIGKNVDDLTEKLNNMNRIHDFDEINSFNDIQHSDKRSTPLKINTSDDTDGLITQAILLNNVEAAVELCFKANRFADALIIATTGGPDLLARTQHKYLQQSNSGVSTLISALISEDWATIINDCDINNWKEALAAALTHSSDDELPILCEQLGNRLENSNLSQDAQLCYICSGSFNKLVNSWSGAAMNSTKDLQELVELVMFLQKAVERQGRQVQISGGLAEVLSHYASLLASQGDLKTALVYLGSTQNEKVASLRDRLYVSLGQKPAFVQEIRQQQSRRTSANRQSFSNYPNTFNSTNPFNATAQNFNTGLPNAPTVNQTWQQNAAGYQQPPKTLSPAPLAPPPTQAPPRPSSRSSQQGSGLPSRKYVLDPSVSSNQYGGMPQYQNNNFANSYMPPQQQQSYVPNVTQPVNPSPLMPGQNSAFNPPPAPVERQPPPPSVGGSNAPPGWNDPPVLTRAAKPQLETNCIMSAEHAGTKFWRKQKQDLSASEPIRHPLFGVAPNEQTNGYGDVNAPPMQPYNPGMYPPPSQHQQSSFNPPPQQQQHQPTMFSPPIQQPINNNFQNSFNPSQFNQNAIPTMSQQPAVMAQEVAREVIPPQPVQKMPIPEEHIHMQTVFDELKNQCSCAAANPQTKRKLEDVGRKLESLYDLLREQKLSPNTLGSLHQLVQLIQNGDYTNGLNLHTQLVSGPDFAQIASFMPGIKVLLQLALQLQVYLR